MLDYIVVKSYMGLDVGSIVKEEDNYLVKVESGNININALFLEESIYFEEYNEVIVESNLYIPDDEKISRFKMELIIECTENERDNIRRYLEKNITDIKNGKGFEN